MRDPGNKVALVSGLVECSTSPWDLVSRLCPSLPSKNGKKKQCFYFFHFSSFILDTNSEWNWVQLGKFKKETGSEIWSSRWTRLVMHFLCYPKLDNLSLDEEPDLHLTILLETQYYPRQYLPCVCLKLSFSFGLSIWLQASKWVWGDSLLRSPTGEIATWLQECHSLLQFTKTMQFTSLYSTNQSY